jgi:signal transduction histidine kinase
VRSILQNIRYRGNIKLGYLTAFILLLLSFLIAYYTNQRLFKNAEIVDHTNRVIANLEYMLSEIKDGEIGSRGYILTGSKYFLDPYYGSKRRTDSVLKILEGLVADNPKQAKTLDSVKNKIVLKYKYINENIISFNLNNGVLTPDLIDSFKQGKLVMDDIRKDINAMQRDEKVLLRERNEKLKKANNGLSIIVIASIVVAFFLVLFGFASHIKENKERVQAEKLMKDSQEELKKRIEELATANKELIKMRREEKFAATGRIARTIAHEIRNPLTNINLAAEQLHSEMLSTDENSGFLFEMIARNSTRINDLISDLLTSTKFSELNFQKISLNELLDAALQQAADRMQLNNVTLIKKYDTAICDITVDKEKLKIAFLNIIINAIEAMEGREPAELTIETKKVADKCVITVSDTGIGMNEEAVSKLFEAYFTSKPKGNGLGLTNTQNIILNHKGDIQVKSKVGVGTSFIITLNIG